MFSLGSGCCRSWLTEDSCKWLWDRGEKGIPGRLRSRVVFWRCGASTLLGPACPAAWGLISQAAGSPTSERWFALLYTVLSVCWWAPVCWDRWKVELAFPWHWDWSFFKPRKQVTTVVLKIADFYLIHSFTANFCKIIGLRFSKY